jgi:cyanophycinase-like exopeptidase
MSGSLALVGSGEYLPAMAEFERSLIDDGLKNGKQPTYIQIPTAAGQESSDRLDYWRQLGKAQADALGVKSLFLPIFTREDAFKLEYLNQIKDSALIYFSGGDPHYLAQTLIDTPLWDEINKSWHSGSSLAGCSAGAMVLSSYIPHFRFSNKEPTPGFNLTPNIRVIPHFDKFFKWIPDSAAKVLLEVPDETILIGVDDLTAIVKRSGDDHWIVQGKAKVHVLKGMPEQQLVHNQKISLLFG